MSLLNGPGERTPSCPAAPPPNPTDAGCNGQSVYCITPVPAAPVAVSVGSPVALESWPSWVEAYRGQLHARDRCSLHVVTTCRHLSELLTLMGGKLSEGGIVGAVGKVRGMGRSLRTCNAYLRSIKSFVRWLSRPTVGVLAVDCARGIVPYKQEGDRRHRRVAYSDEELAKLLKAAAGGVAYRGITGPERAALYRAAAATGLRAGTLELVDVGQFNLGPEHPVPHVQVWAEQLKDAEDLVVPIEPHTAAELRAHFRCKLPAARAFRLPPQRCDLVRMLRKDLAAAGIEYCQTVPLPNGGGVRRVRVRDFHALRLTFGTRGARAGVPLTTMQRWLGHSDPKLTANLYTSVELADAATAWRRLPPITGGEGPAA